ncbi:uncharacterized protein A4U43_C03F12820 [Asparagus officinalis]|uniref:Uncharacterized protein n=1 Tax=Asparagus officinalis TaxID=4686 RepID=A0A5P1FA57_ASPOF|nr:uncharacterized protein A4U43_C03F12820 [Asparagus officinalis]
MAPLPVSVSILTTETPLPSSPLFKAPSFVDRTERLLKSLGALASEHPLLKPLLSFHSQFRDLFKECPNAKYACSLPIWPSTFNLHV